MTYIILLMEHPVERTIRRGESSTLTSLPVIHQSSCSSKAECALARLGGLNRYWPWPYTPPASVGCATALSFAGVLAFATAVAGLAPPLALTLVLTFA